MSPLYVSYYTLGTPYKAEADALAATLDRWDLDHRIYARPDLGSWQANCQQKADVIAEAMGYGRAVCWLDADSRVEAPPALFTDLSCDLAAHWLGGEELLAGTLYFGATDAARRLVRDWQAMNAANPDGKHGDQQNLQDAVEQATTLNIVTLPPEYAWIQPGEAADISHRLYGAGSPVIRQTQASRRLRT